MASTPRPYTNRHGETVWRLPFRLVPGGKVTTETFDTIEDALAFGRLVDQIGGQAAREARTASTHAPATVPTLASWFDTHLTALSAHVTPGTIDDYQRMAARTWLPPLGPLPLTAITKTEINTWVTAQRHTETVASKKARKKAQVTNGPVPAIQYYQAKSIANAHGLLSSVLEAAVDAELLPRNPARGVKLPRDQHHKEMVFLTSDEFAELLACVPGRWRVFVTLLYATGLRFGEATALQAVDFHLNGDTAYVRVSRAWKKGRGGRRYLGAPKTRNAVRAVSLPASLIDPLRALLESRRPQDLAFVAVRGGRIHGSAFHNQVWQSAVTAADLGKRPRVHDLRHTHASLMLSAGMPLFELQYRLGHSSLKQTADRYGHLLPTALASGARYAEGTL